MSQTTKRALAASLKKLLIHKPLSKITITDITEDCEVNRHTFYYHFQDIYDLIEWIYVSEAARILGDKKTAATWQQGFQNIFDYLIENSSFVLNTFHSLNREHLERFLYEQTYHLLYDVVDEEAAAYTVSEADKAFIADFYKYGFVGIVLDWISKGMREEPQTIIQRLYVMIHGNITKALHDFEKEH